MKVSCDWLSRYCEPVPSPDQLARMLPELGLEVDTVNQVAGDTVFVLETAANRPDLLSMIGVAREVAAATDAELKIPEVDLQCGGENVAGLTRVGLNAPDLCIRYTARLVTGVKVAPSPMWLQERLASIGLRPVNNIVDITNFVLMECGQPLHAFDFDKLIGKEIVVRRAAPGEEITVIDGTVHKLTEEMLVIADAEVPTAVAGVMGGLATEIGDSTTNVLLESAVFLPANIRRTSRALGLASDSSYRFERGVDPNGVDWGSVRAAAMIAEMAGGQVAQGVIAVGEPVPEAQVVTLRTARTDLVLGVSIPAEEQQAMLERLGFTVVAERPGEFDLSVPTFRQEVRREVDLIEELARAYGYEKIPEETRMRVRAVPVQKFDSAAARVRELCTGMGYSEARTSSFIAPDLAARFTYWSAEANVIRNPVSREEPALRTSLIPLLLRAKKQNLNRGTPRVALFELSRVYQTASGVPSERTCLGLVDDGGFASLRGALDALFDHLGVSGQVAYAEHSDANLTAGRSTKLLLGGQPLGVAGEITTELANLFDLKSAPAVAELDFDLLLGSASLERRYHPLPKFPSVRRDLSVVVDEDVAWAALCDCANTEGGELSDSIAFLSEYHGEQIEPGKKAVAFSITYRAPDRTLTGEEADEAIARVARAMKDRFGAELRA